ncbi:nonstructural protein [Apis mellifera associated microvirus 31]|nr:nonstructural protein [Apis mellifera associated microvirus 31]
MKLFAMLDKKAGHFLQPFPETSTIAALRGFEIAVNDAKSIFCRFPDDFSLMELADFDQETGQISPYATPQDLGSARTVLKKPAVQDTLPGVQ